MTTRTRVRVTVEDLEDAGACHEGMNDFLEFAETLPQKMSKNLYMRKVTEKLPEQLRGIREGDDEPIAVGVEILWGEREQLLIMQKMGEWVGWAQDCGIIPTFVFNPHMVNEPSVFSDRYIGMCKTRGVMMANHKIERAVFSHGTYEQFDLTQTAFDNCKFFLTLIDLGNLYYTVFNNVRTSMLKITNSRAIGTTLSSCEIVSSPITNTDLSKVLVSDTVFRWGNFHECQIGGMFLDTKFDECTIVETHFNKPTFDRCEFKGVVFRDISLGRNSNSDFSTPPYQRTRFVNCNFTNVVLSNVDFLGAAFRNVTFTDCAFYNCRVSRDTRMTDVTFAGHTVLDGTDFSTLAPGRVRGLDKPLDSQPAE